MALHHTTPIFRNPSIDTRLNINIYFKMDCFQPVGSFKIRGIGLLCEHAKAQGKTRLISSSGGNAGYAAAYAGKQLGIPVTVVVPDTTSETAMQRMREQDAEVIIHGSVWNEADAYAQQLVTEMDGAYIHPFDDPVTWEGHASLIEEATQQMIKPDVVVVAVGGGGLLMGVLTGLHAHGWGDVPVIAVETDGAASFHALKQAGHIVRLDSITSIAKTLGALQVTDALVEWINKHPIESVTVTDSEAVNACLQFADDFRAIVEPACGAALSLVYDNASQLDNYQTILMVVCGGAGATFQQLLRWQEQTYAKF